MLGMWLNAQIDFIVLPSDRRVKISSASSCEYFDGRPSFEVVFMPPNFAAMRYNSNENPGADSSKCQVTKIGCCSCLHLAGGYFRAEAEVGCQNFE